MLVVRKSDKKTHFELEDHIKHLNTSDQVEQIKRKRDEKSNLIFIVWIGGLYALF